MRTSTKKEITEKINDMEERLAKRERKDIKYAVPGLVLIERTNEAAEERLRRLLPENKNLRGKIEKTGYVGSPETVAARILEKDETGIDYIILQCAPTVLTLQTLEEQVFPLL